MDILQEMIKDANEFEEAQGEFNQKIEKLKGKNKEEQFKILWQWVKQSNINFEMFKKLVNFVEKDVKESLEGEKNYAGNEKLEEGNEDYLKHLDLMDKKYGKIPAWRIMIDGERKRIKSIK